MDLISSEFIPLRDKIEWGYIIPFAVSEMLNEHPRAAMELRNAHPTAQKMKLCYAVKDDEWWAIFYEDAGTHYELKQYVWDRQREHLDPFLVLRRIPKDRLQQALSGDEPDRACEVINLPPPSKQEGLDLKAGF